MTEHDITLCGHGSGTPSTKNMYSYLESRYNSFASTNGKRKGLVCVRRFKALTDEDRKRFVEKYKTILGRNIYSQELRTFVYRMNGTKFYSDCSSSLCATLQQIGFNVGLLNTAGIYESSLFETVNVKISAGHVEDPEKLKVADFLLFAGNDPARPLQIGHVEAIYDIAEDLPQVPVSAMLQVMADGLNARSRPTTAAPVTGMYAKGVFVTASAKSGTWFKTERGWISRKYLRGWIKEDGRFWYIENGSYPISTVKTIDGGDYAFDREGWMIDRWRISDTGEIKY